MPKPVRRHDGPPGLPADPETVVDVLDVALDLAGGQSVLGWGIGFGHVTLALLAGAVAFVWLRPADLAGDRVAKRGALSRRAVP